MNEISAECDIINGDPSTNNTAIEVEAQIDSWRDGEYGPYAHARILTQGAPATSATCSKVLKGLEPPIGTPFRCLIKSKPNGKGYGVVEWLVDGLPSEISDVSATVQRKRGIDFLLEAELVRGGKVSITLPGKVLTPSQIAFIPEGFPVVVNAARTASGYEATALHAPTVADILDPDLVPAMPVTLVCLVLSNWDAAHAKPKGAYVGVRRDLSGLVAKIWVDKALLSAAGIPSLHAADSDGEADPGADQSALQTWEAVLRKGDDEERAALDIDRLELELEWVDAKQAWRVCQLVAPRAVREPGFEGEVVDWVSGRASGEVQLGAAAKPKVPGPDDDPERSEGARTYHYMMLAYEDSRLGRGTVRLNGAERIVAAGVADGVPVVMSLVGKGRYWQLRALHRSWPFLPREED